MWPFKSKPKVQRLQEDISGGGIMGDRYPIEQLATFKYVGNSNGFVFGRDLFPWKSTTIRTIWDHDRQRYVGRELYESNCNAKGVLNGLRGYVIGKGLTLKVVDIDQEAEGDTELQEQDGPPPAPQSQDPSQPGSALLPAAPEKPEASPLAKKVKKLLDEFSKRNKIKDWQKEIFVRWHRDGEAFLRLFPQVDEPTLLRAIEPDMVRPPVGESLEGPWAFGIRTALDDWDVPEKYNIIYTKERHEQVDAEFVHHIKNNVVRNVRRGISTYWACSDELYGASKLRYASREGEKVRQSIAYLRQHESAPKSTITQLQADSQTATQKKWDADGAQRDIPLQRQEPGSVIDIPKGLTYLQGPVNPQDGAKLAESQGLLAVAAAWTVCSFLVTGEGDASSYAGAVVAESPMQHSIEDQQEAQTDFWQDVFEAAVKIEIEKGNLPEDTLDLVEIHVVAPNPARDKLDAIEGDQILVKAGLMSDETAATRQNLDLDEEIAKGAQKAPEPVAGVPGEGGPAGSPKTPSGKLQADAGSPPRANPR